MVRREQEGAVHGMVSRPKDPRFVNSFMFVLQVHDVALLRVSSPPAALND